MKMKSRKKSAKLNQKALNKLDLINEDHDDCLKFYLLFLLLNYGY